MTPTLDNNLNCDEYGNDQVDTTSTRVDHYYSSSDDPVSNCSINNTRASRRSTYNTPYTAIKLTYTDQSPSYAASTTMDTTITTPTQQPHLLLPTYPDPLFIQQAHVATAAALAATSAFNHLDNSTGCRLSTINNYKRPRKSSISRAESSEETRRMVHVQMEKKRRAMMNAVYDELDMELPPLSVARGIKRPPKYSVLQRALEHIRTLKAANTCLNQELAQLRMKGSSIPTSISSSNGHTPLYQVSPTHPLTLQSIHGETCSTNDHPLAPPSTNTSIVYSHHAPTMVMSHEHNHLTNEVVMPGSSMSTVSPTSNCLSSALTVSPLNHPSPLQSLPLSSSIATSTGHSQVSFTNPLLSPILFSTGPQSVTMSSSSSALQMDTGTNGAVPPIHATVVTSPTSMMFSMTKNNGNTDTDTDIVSNSSTLPPL